MRKWPTCEEYCYFWIGRCWQNENYPDPNLGEKSSVCVFALDKNDEQEIKRVIKLYPEIKELQSSTPRR